MGTINWYTPIISLINTSDYLSSTSIFSTKFLFFSYPHPLLSLLSTCFLYFSYYVFFPFPMLETSIATLWHCWSPQVIPRAQADPYNWIVFVLSLYLQEWIVIKHKCSLSSFYVSGIELRSLYLIRVCTLQQPARQLWLLSPVYTCKKRGKKDLASQET